MNGGSFWAGTLLVARRAMVESFSSKSWRAITALLLLIGMAVVIVPRFFGQEEASYTLAVVGPASPGLAAQLEAAAVAADFELTINDVADPATAREAVRDGAADAALSSEGESGTLYVGLQTSATFPALVAQASVATASLEALAAAGLDGDQIAALLTIPPPEQVAVGRVADQGRAGVGFAVGIVLYLALILTGTSIATAVATEKSTRISEVLLAVLRPSQLLVGTVVGVGLLGLIQVAALAVPAAVGLATGDVLEVPASAIGDVALAVAWFVVGMAMYAFAFAALGALVEKPTEVGSATMPVNVALIASYLLAVTVTIANPGSWVSVAASMFPLSAPLVMPVRWASGLVPGWQLALALALTAAAAIAMAALASRVYSRGIARTGSRVKLREVL